MLLFLLLKQKFVSHQKLGLDIKKNKNRETIQQNSIDSLHLASLYKTIAIYRELTEIKHLFSISKQKNKNFKLCVICVLILRWVIYAHHMYNQFKSISIYQRVQIDRYREREREEIHNNKIHSQISQRCSLCF